jgi:hypothetical protein
MKALLTLTRSVLQPFKLWKKGLDPLLRHFTTASEIDEANATASGFSEVV